LSPMCSLHFCSVVFQDKIIYSGGPNQRLIRISADGSTILTADYTKKRPHHFDRRSPLIYMVHNKIKDLNTGKVTFLEYMRACYNSQRTLLSETGEFCVRYMGSNREIILRNGERYEIKGLGDNLNKDSLSKNGTLTTELGKLHYKNGDYTWDSKTKQPRSIDITKQD